MVAKDCPSLQLESFFLVIVSATFAAMAAPYSRNPRRRLSRVIKRDHPIVINAVVLRPVLRGDVSRKRPDVPRAEVQDVGHRGVG